MSEPVCDGVNCEVHRSCSGTFRYEQTRPWYLSWCSADGAHGIAAKLRADMPAFVVQGVVLLPRHSGVRPRQSVRRCSTGSCGHSATVCAQPVRALHSSGRARPAHGLLARIRRRRSILLPQPARPLPARASPPRGPARHGAERAARLHVPQPRGHGALVHRLAGGLAEGAGAGAHGPRGSLPWRVPVDVVRAAAPGARAAPHPRLPRRRGAQGTLTAPLASRSAARSWRTALRRRACRSDHRCS
jgi:hypothetical protein